METVSSSSKHPSGLFLGDYFRFVNGYSANLVGILASMRIISTYKQFLRPRPVKKGDSNKRVNFSDLQELFNLKAGLKGKDDYTSSLLKSVFKILVSPSTRSFPGGWIHSAKLSNSVKSVTGLLFSMGWAECVPLKSKILDVVFNEVQHQDNSKSKLKVVNKKDMKKNSSFIEYRTGVALLLPMIDPTSNVSLDEQINLDPLRIKDEKIINNYSNVAACKLVDKLNHTSALKQSCSVKDSKTKPIHYEMARNELLHLSDKVQLRDARGHTYKLHSEIPENVNNFLKKKLAYPIKRVRETDSMDIDSGNKHTVQADSAKHIRFSEPNSKKVAGEDLSPNTQDTSLGQGVGLPSVPVLPSRGAPNTRGRGRK